MVQDQGDWQVEYRLRYDGGSDLSIAPGEVQARVETWVSNSRVASHAVPRCSVLLATGGSPPPSPAAATGALAGSIAATATAEVIASSDEAQRCRERLVAQVWTGAVDPPIWNPVPEPGRSAPHGADFGSPTNPAESSGSGQGNGVGDSLRLSAGERSGSVSGSSTCTSSMASTTRCWACARSSSGSGRPRWSMRTCRPTTSNIWRSRAGPGRSRRTTDATHATSSRPPTACTSKRTFPATSITGIPSARCGMAP